jgi:ketosteroid isomerase-like protein
VSEENVATMRAIFEAVNRGDLDDTVARIPEEDFVADWSESVAPERGVYRGRDEVEYFESEIIDAGDLVVRVGGLRARGTGSGAEVTARGTQVWRFRGGTPISVRLYQSKAEALEATGLSG